VLNQAFFQHLYLDADDDGPYVASDELAAVVAPIVDVARWPGPGEPHNAKRRPRKRGAVSAWDEVEVLTSYSNPSEQVRELRAALARLSGPDAPADEPELGVR